MATPYSVIHSSAIHKFSDYGLLDFVPSDRDRMLWYYLRSAIVDFQRICRTDLSDRDEELQQFNQDLDDEVIEILATGEAYYWVKPLVASQENFHNQMNTKDYSFFSPANLLDKLLTLQEQLWDEFKRKMFDYSYRSADMTTVPNGR